MVTPASPVEGRIEALLARAERLLLAEKVGIEERELADSCRETAKELRLFAVFVQGTEQRQKTLTKERSNGRKRVQQVHDVEEYDV